MNGGLLVALVVALTTMIKGELWHQYLKPEMATGEFCGVTIKKLSGRKISEQLRKLENSQPLWSSRRKDGLAR